MQDWGGPIGITAAAKDPARVRGLVIANTWAWPVNGDPRFEIASRMMGGPLGRLAITRLNMFVNVMLPMGHRLRKLTHDEMQAYREAMSTPTARRAAAALPAAILGERQLLKATEEAVTRFADRESLIVWADKDVAFRQPELEHWRRLLPASIVVPVPGAGHFVESDAPEAVAAAIRSSFA
jgi:haloalkane dehalogenase